MESERKTDNIAMRAADDVMRINIVLSSLLWQYIYKRVRYYNNIILYKAYTGQLGSMNNAKVIRKAPWCFPSGSSHRKNGKSPHLVLKQYFSNTSFSCIIVVIKSNDEYRYRVYSLIVTDGRTTNQRLSFFFIIII